VLEPIVTNNQIHTGLIGQLRGGRRPIAANGHRNAGVSGDKQCFVTHLLGAIVATHALRSDRAAAIPT
jgi:hypothetical protein